MINGDGAPAALLRVAPPAIRASRGKGGKGSDKSGTGSKGGKGSKGWSSSGSLSSSYSGDHGHWTWIGGGTGPADWTGTNGGSLTSTCLSGKSGKSRGSSVVKSGKSWSSTRVEDNHWTNNGWSDNAWGAPEPSGGSSSSGKSGREALEKFGKSGGSGSNKSGKSDGSGSGKSGKSGGSSTTSAEDDDAWDGDGHIDTSHIK